MEELYRNKDWLENQHWKEGKSIRKIAEEIGVGKSAIWYWIKKLDIPHHSKHNYCKLSSKAIEFMEGELLGDGSLASFDSPSALFRYTSKHWEYINYIADTLKLFGIEQSGKIQKRWKGMTSKNGQWINQPINLFPKSFCYQSLSYIELKTLYGKWYPNGKKIVPKDMELTPLTCRQWYIGDGCLVKRKTGKPSIVIYTYSFPEKDVDWLVNKLNNIGFISSRIASHNSIHISTKSTTNFLNYVGKPEVKCYQYKWRL